MRNLISYLVLCLSCFLGGFVDAAPVRSLNELKQQMTQQGKPALIIAGADWCVYCREMAQELARDPKLQPLQAQYAILKIDADTPVWPAAKRAFGFEENGVPAVFVFRADGDKLYSGAGKPANLETFLKNNLKKAGRILTVQESQILTKDLTKLKAVLKRNDLAEAIKISFPYELEKSYAQPALAMTAVQKKIKEQVTEQLSKLEEKLKTSSEDVEAVYELLTLKENCASSPELSRSIAEVEQLAQKSRLTVQQAELLIEADQFSKNRKRRDERAIYEKIIAQYPETAVAQIAQNRLGNPKKPGMKSSTVSEKTFSDSVSLKKAEAYLKIGKKLLGVKSPKAKTYLQKVIDEAPESQFAKEARELIK